MAHIPPSAPSRQMHRIFTQMQSHEREKYCWWQEEGPEKPCIDANGYPRAWVFGQVIGEYVGLDSKYFELVAPLCDDQTWTFRMLRRWFNNQIRHLESFRRPFEVVDTAFEGPWRCEAERGLVFRVHTEDYAQSLLGSIVLIEISMIPVPDQNLARLEAVNDEDYVWWGKRGPESASYDVHGYPAAFMFGQVVMGDTTRELELAKPAFIDQLRLTAVVGNYFDAQCRNLANFQHQSDQPVFVPAAVRQDVLHGKVFRVALVRNG
ncbi:hypothetical protein C8R43DRAFT_1130889 [Mycena crocata]|nr:hypothetical protein C8R43DRAFT_1130889 [Mycena crocata]